VKGKRLGYVRVSSVDQNPERQLEGIELDKKYIEYASGKTVNRPVLQSLLDYAREDDVIYIHSMDRLARNVKNLLDIVDSLIGRGIQIKFIKENLTFSSQKSPMNDLLLVMLGSVAQFEHAMIRERQLEGIAIAKRAGKYKGGQPKLTYDRKIELKNRLDSTRITKRQLAKEFGISRECLYRYLRQLENEKKQSVING